MNKEQAEAARYFAESRSWAVDRLEALKTSRRRMAAVAIGAAALSIVEGLALIALLPLKTVVPYMVLVDRHTGYVQAIDPTGRSALARDDALIQSLLVQYVEAREAYDAGQVRTAYARVGLWSAEAARADYQRGMNPGNPESPIARYPASTVIEASVKSVSPIAPGTALVRFDTIRRDGDAPAGPVQPWAAVIRYRFADAAMSTADRFHNPLGFQVVRYRRDAEALPPADRAAELSAATAPPPRAVAIPAALPVPVRPARVQTAARTILIDDRSLPMGNPLAPPAGAR
jgi:type IV secretion system protein VirB8